MVLKKMNKRLLSKEQGVRAGGECSGQKVLPTMRRSGWEREHNPAWGPELMTFRERSRVDLQRTLNLNLWTKDG